MNRQPRFKMSDYIGFEMPSGDMEGFIESHTSRLVKCRKEHQCSYCGAPILKGDFAVYEKGFMDGEPVGVHDCLDCVDDVLRGWDDDAQERWEKRARGHDFL